jgi:hypothetical protein
MLPSSGYFLASKCKQQIARFVFPVVSNNSRTDAGNCDVGRAVNSFTFRSKIRYEHSRFEDRRVFEVTIIVYFKTS